MLVPWEQEPEMQGFGSDSCLCHFFLAKSRPVGLGLGGAQISFAYFYDGSVDPKLNPTAGQPWDSAAYAGSRGAG